MSQLGVMLQESLQREREERTILGLLTEQMESVSESNNNREPRRRRSLKERLRFTRMGCCGATWGFRSTTVRHEGGEEEEEEEEEEDDERRQQQQRLQEPNPGQRSSSSDPDCVSPNPMGSGMNLAAALAAERQYRGTQEPERGSEGSTGNNLRRGGAGVGPGTPWRVSLMRLLEEAEGGEAEVTVTVTEKGGLGNDTVCCVCMGRKKGAAFIPCGHTFCRVCSRELWLNRGTCPLCNRSILEILDIF